MICNSADLPEEMIGGPWVLDSPPIIHPWWVIEFQAAG
jgi:hypothetical protein